VLALFWQWVWEPMLFVTIGNSIDFATLDRGIIPRSLIIICSGVSLRAMVTFAVMQGFGYTWREKLFYAVAWTPKATVQAALSGGWVGGCVCGRVGGWVGDRWYGWVVWVAGLLCQVARSPAGTAASLRPDLTLPAPAPPAPALLQPPPWR
jgi:hypothetical protein